MHQKRSTMRNLAMITQLGLSVMTPIFVCILAGYYIDRHFGTRLMLPLLALGFLAGGWSGYKVAKTTLLMDEKEALQEEQKKAGEKTPRTAVRKPKQASRVRKDKEAARRKES